MQCNIHHNNFPLEGLIGLPRGASLSVPSFAVAAAAAPAAKVAPFATMSPKSTQTDTVQLRAHWSSLNEVLLPGIVAIAKMQEMLKLQHTERANQAGPVGH